MGQEELVGISKSHPFSTCTLFANLLQWVPKQSRSGLRARFHECQNYPENWPAEVLFLVRRFGQRWFAQLTQGGTAKSTHLVLPAQSKHHPGNISPTNVGQVKMLYPLLCQQPPVGFPSEGARVFDEFRSTPCLGRTSIEST